LLAKITTTLDLIPGHPPSRRGLAGDPDGVAEQAAELLDAGLDGLIFSLPDASDLNSMALAGETLSPSSPHGSCAALFSRCPTPQRTRCEQRFVDKLSHRRSGV
jgi:hypothetical protein